MTLAWFGHRLPVELKDDATPVTEVDRRAERAIRAAIAERFPGDAVLGEEEGLRAGANGRRWVVDPVDGTKLYAEGIPLWTTLIALEVDGVAVVGVADAPAIGDRYHATRGGGAWRGDRRLRVSEVGSLAESFVAHSGVEEWVAGGHGERAAASRRPGSAHPRAERRLGASARGAGVRRGAARARAVPAWDWAATGVIVEEAGGCITTLSRYAPDRRAGTCWCRTAWCTARSSTSWRPPDERSVASHAVGDGFACAPSSVAVAGLAIGVRTARGRAAGHSHSADETSCCASGSCPT